MGKLIISKAELKSFSVSKFKDHEGCPDAIKLLYRRYGDRVDNLLNYKDDFLHIISIDNKPHWTINFICNLLTESSKMSFYDQYLDNIAYSTGSKEVTQFCLKTFLDIRKNRLSQNNFNQLAKLIKDDLELKEILVFDSIEYKKLMLREHLLKSIQHLMKDDQRLFTRSMTSALMSLADAQSQFDIEGSQDNLKQKSIAVDLLEFSEIF
jgi:arsenate reductase-like glutaredoxin family protein